MRKCYTLYNIYESTRMLLIVGCLLLTSSGIEAWGRTITNNEAGFPQPNVPEIVYTIYMEQNSTRQLTIAGLNSFSGQWVDEYQWYIRWYRMDADGNAENIFSPLAKPTTGSNLEVEDGNRSLFWYKGVGGGQIPTANKVNYTKGTKDDIVVCDVSSYTDGLPSGTTGTVTEPVISKRYKFIIKDANEIRTKLNAVTGDAALDTVLITVPKGATGVNLQMEMTPENYYWDRNYQGSTFTATDKNGNTVTGSFTNNNKMFHFSNAIETETTVKIYANTNNNRNVSPCIALFKITPQEGWELSTEKMIEGNIQRNPRLYPKRYQEIASYDFDLEQVQATLSVQNNISTTPLPAEYTSYGFTNPTLNSRNAFFTPKRNNYGLYRSANHPDYSKNHPTSYTIGTQNRTYDWYFARTVSDTVLYDRTYVRSKGTEYGYFYYIDASEEAGRIVSVPIGETLCPGTELTITAWVANMTDENNTKPNLRFILRGVLKDDQDTEIEEEIYRFSTGEPVDAHHGEWLQVFYTITLQSEQASRYSSYKVEVQNNALNSDGADYAIDDIRVYKSLPNISVQRNDVCDASTFYVSSDYENILRNMGWSNDPDVVSGLEGIEKGLTEANKHIWKYRYGLLGEDASNPEHFPYVGNMYLAFAKDMALSSDQLEAWVTMNNDLLEYDNKNYNKRSKLFRITIPTTYTGTGADNALLNRFGKIKTQEEARGLQILWNLRMINDFLFDAQKPENIWDDVIQKYAIDPKTHEHIEKNTYLAILEEGLKTLCNKSTWDYKIQVDNMHDQLQAIMAGGETGERYENLLRSVCSVLGISRLRVPWWTFDKDDHPLDIHLSTIDVQKTDL